MTLVSERASLGIRRRFTVEGSDSSADVAWGHRDARLIDHRDGSVTFEQFDVEVPESWSQNATNILAQKYFRGTLGTPERESSLRQVVSRIVDTITAWGKRDGYFADAAEAESFQAELVHLLITQKAAFNSPVWFNIGVKGVPQQASACFILSVDDTMESILNWYSEEGRIFKGGSGAGVNLSRIRASMEGLDGGGTASGPVSFMRGADASAGTIKSGGKTRRAAKMVILDADHPDIKEFIWCKAREERKARALEAAGFDMSLDGIDIHSVQYQNANNSVRVSDEFMQAALDNSDWALKARSDGSTIRTVKARDILGQIAEASWECADPGIQFDTTINHWNTAANTGRINASNPCSEYLHLDDSACNLASLNLLPFLVGDTGLGDGVSSFDIEGFVHAVRIVFTAQEILVGNADYPTAKIAENARDFRQLGLGYANLGAVLMTLGLPYDSDGGRAVAASLTALMTGEAYCQSTRLAARMGPFKGFSENREHMLRVLDQHRVAVAEVDEDHAPNPILEAAQRAWDQACELAKTSGVRNAQATVLAPTGTIGLLMDCDTTGVEPDLGLVKFKRLVGGGTMSFVNQSVPRALRNLGYSQEAVEAIVAYINEHHSAVGAPGLDPSDLPVFACSLGADPIHYPGHLKMMGAVQPFISGAISKTVNLPEEATVADIESLLIESWKLGLKAVALYRDNCKVAQPLSAGAATRNGSQRGSEASASHNSGNVALEGWSNATRDVTSTGPDASPRGGSAAKKPVNQPVRERLPRTRASRTFEFRVADCKGFVTVGEYPDGRPGEIFVRVSKLGSTLSGIMDAFAISLSNGLQYGVPLSAFVRAFVGMRFEPAGMTDDPDIRIANSLMDYLFRRLAVMYLSDEERSRLQILTTGERIQPTLPGVEEQVTKTVQGSDIPPHRPKAGRVAQLSLVVDEARGAPFCMTCGIPMRRAGACYVCGDCGTTSGCS